MKPAKATVLCILISVIFSVFIILGDFVTEGTLYNETVKYSLLALAYIPMAYISLVIPFQIKTITKAKDESE